MTLSRSIHRLAAAVLLVAMMAASLPALTSAQDTTTNTERRTISVEGTGTVEVAPDTADISLGVMVQNESLEAAQQENSERTQSIMDALTEGGIAEEDIATSRYMVYPINEYDRDGNLVGIQAYEVSSGIDITVRDLSAVGQVLEDAVAAGANQVNTISFYVDNTDEPASEARSMAIENARVKADEIAEAAGVIVVGIYDIEETSSPDAEAVRFDMPQGEAIGMGGSADQASMNVPVAPGQTTVTVKVKVVYEIEQPLG